MPSFLLFSLSFRHRRRSTRQCCFNNIFIIFLKLFLIFSYFLFRFQQHCYYVIDILPRKFCFFKIFLTTLKVYTCISIFLLWYFLFFLIFSWGEEKIFSHQIKPDSFVTKSCDKYFFFFIEYLLTLLSCKFCFLQSQEKNLFFLYILFVASSRSLFLFFFSLGPHD